MGGNMGLSRSTRPEIIAARERAVEALRLRAAGESFDAIASELGYAGRSGAYKAVQRVLDSSEHEAAEELRTIGLIRLEAILRRLWPIATNEESRVQFRAIDACLDVIHQISALSGLTQAGSRIRGTER